MNLTIHNHINLVIWFCWTQPILFFFFGGGGDFPFLYGFNNLMRFSLALLIFWFLSQFIYYSFNSLVYSPSSYELITDILVSLSFNREPLFDHRTTVGFYCTILGTILSLLWGFAREDRINMRNTTRPVREESIDLFRFLAGYSRKIHQKCWKQ